MAAAAQRHGCNCRTGWSNHQQWHGEVSQSLHQQRRTQLRRSKLVCRAESKEYYDYKDMPPLPLTVKRIHIPKLGYTVVDKSNENVRLASLAIFYDLYKDEQYRSCLTRKSAITALCMYDRDDVDEAERNPGTFPNIDLLQRVYSEGMELDFTVEEFTPN